eukprot:1494351-Prymnesium_polylepis.1
MPHAILDGLDAARARPAHQPLEPGLVEAQQAHAQHVVIRSLYHHTVLHVRVHLQAGVRPVPHQVVGRRDLNALRAPRVVEVPREARLRVLQLELHHAVRDASGRRRWVGDDARLVSEHPVALARTRHLSNPTAPEGLGLDLHPLSRPDEWVAPSLVDQLVHDGLEHPRRRRRRRIMLEPHLGEQILHVRLHGALLGHVGQLELGEKRPRRAQH